MGLTDTMGNPVPPPAPTPTPTQGCGAPPNSTGFFPPSSYQPNQNPGFPSFPGYGCAPYQPPHANFYPGGYNMNGSGTQTNGGLQAGNHQQRKKSGNVKIGSIGGNHGNNGGQQVHGDVTVGNIGCS